MPLIYLVAGEASGDVLGSRLMAALKSACPGVTFAGVAGPRMQAEGMASLFPMSDLAVMGLVEILPKIRTLRRRMLSVVADIKARHPDIVVTVDSLASASTCYAGSPPLESNASNTWRPRSGPGASTG